MKFTNRKNKGFTLIELLIYVAVLAIVSVLVMGTIVMTMRAFNRIKVARAIDDSAKSAMERMVNEIRYASNIDLGQSTLGAHPGKLVLDSVDRTSGATTTIEFSLGGDLLRIKEGSSDYQDIVSSGVQVTNLVFRNIAASSTSKAVKIEMSVKATKGSYERISNFYDTVILRQSY